MKWLLALMTCCCLTVSSYAQITTSPFVWQENWHTASSWLLLDTLIEKQYYSSALQKCDSVYDSALKQKKAGLVFRAALYHMHIVDNYLEDAKVNNITWLESQINKFSFPYNNLAAVYLADLYKKLYGNHVQDKTTSINCSYTALPLNQWGTQQYTEKCMSLWLQAVQQKQALQQLSLARFDTLIDYDPIALQLQPTLFDFIANQLLNQLESEKDLLFFNMKQFKINNDLMCTAANFSTLLFPADIAWEKAPAANEIPLSFALQLHRALLLQHLNDTTSDALVYADYKRITFVNNHFKGPDQNNKYRLELQTLLQTHSQESSSTQAAYYLAKQLLDWSDDYTSNQHNDPIAYYRFQAYKTCEMYRNRFPHSLFADYCEQVLKAITVHDFQLTTEEIALPNQLFKAKLSFKNCKHLYVKIFNYPKNLNLADTMVQANIKFWSSKRAPYSFDIALFPPDDYYTHETEIKFPALPVGDYLILYSDSAVSNTRSKIGYSTLKVSAIHLSLVQTNNSTITGYVKNRISGKPIANATVSVRNELYTDTICQAAIAPVHTNKFGTFTINIPASALVNSNRFLYKVSTASDSLLVEDKLFEIEKTPIIPDHSNLVFYTDRNIYKPGQTIQFKCIALNATKNEVVPNLPITVYLSNDYNAESIMDSLKLLTNSVGSVAGIFTLPENCISGDYWLVANGAAQQIKVEYYKRPTFTIDVIKDKRQFRIGDSIVLHYKVNAYNGIALDGIKINYKISLRQFSTIQKGCEEIGAPMEQDDNVYSGTTTCTKDGKFELRFVAAPIANDQHVHPLNQWLYYTISTIAIAESGETHELNEDINICLHPTTLYTDLPETMYLSGSNNAFTLTAESNNATSANCKGTYTIYHLETPKQYYKSRLWQFTAADQPDIFTIPYEEHQQLFPDELYVNESDVSSYKIVDSLKAVPFSTATTPVQHLSLKLSSGFYKIVYSAIDNLGNTVNRTDYIKLINTTKIDTLPDLFANYTLASTYQPGEAIKLNYRSAIAGQVVQLFIQKNKELIQTQFLNCTGDWQNLTIKTKAKQKGDYTLTFLFLYHNRVYTYTTTIAEALLKVEPLTLTCNSFRSPLYPGSSEKWVIQLNGAKTVERDAELLVGMYDASLDAITKNMEKDQDWSQVPNFEYEALSNQFDIKYFEPTTAEVNTIVNRTDESSDVYFNLNFANFHNSFITVVHFVTLGCYNSNFNTTTYTWTVTSKNADMALGLDTNKDVAKPTLNKAQSVANAILPAVRRNFNETAFFYPQLKFESNGSCQFDMQTPESITQWRFRALAHTKDQRFAYYTNLITTRKDLQVSPHLPRFIREEEVVEIPVAITNNTDRAINTNVLLDLTDAQSKEQVAGIVAKVFFKDKTSELLIPNNLQTVFIAAHSTETVYWSIRMPVKNCQSLLIKVVATGDRSSDGEENCIPVLPKQQLLYATQSFYQKFGTTKTYKLPASLGQTNTTSERLTIQLTTEPLWNVVLALPYLIENKQACAEQVFSRFYANYTALTLEKKYPALSSIIKQWMQLPDSLKLTALDKNQDLKAMQLQATPWIVDARTTQQQQAHLGMILNPTQLQQETVSAQTKLSTFIAPNGAFEWYKGLGEDLTITTYITQNLLKLALENNDVSFFDALIYHPLNYLQKNLQQPINSKLLLSESEVHQYYCLQLAQLIAAKNHLELSSTNDSLLLKLYKQLPALNRSMNADFRALLAKVYFYAGNRNNALLFLNSLKQSALLDSTKGMYWKSETENTFQSAIETQANIITAFQLISPQDPALPDLVKWLLIQKETQHWPTTTGTTQAITALLNGVSDLTSDNSRGEISAGSTKLSWNNSTQTTTQGIQFNMDKPAFQPLKDSIKIFTSTTPASKNSTLIGSILYSYWKPLTHASVAQVGNGFSIRKELWYQPAGGQSFWMSDSSGVQIGELIEVKLHFHVTRAMDYVQLTDQQSGSTEVVEMASGYSYQNGLTFYKSMDASAAHFFIPHIEKGDYVISYKIRSNHRGTFNAGIASIECLYAPQFKAYSNTQVFTAQ